MKLNLPNKLTLLRVILVPVAMAAILLPQNGTLACVLGAAIFLVTSLTDMLDGKIARKRNLITNFGKFMDPLADKFMVFGVLLAILVRFGELAPVLVWVTALVILRELAVTSVRLIASGSSGKVIAASYLGKAKTVTQVVCIMTILLEPVLFSESMPVLSALSVLSRYHILTYLTMAAMVVMTVWSGIDYLRAYWSDIRPDK